MTNATKDHRKTGTKYEVVETAAAQTSPSATQYESVEGPDNSSPDAEATNTAARAQLTAGLVEIESGSDGLVETAAALDAIIGSYPELADAAEVIIGTDERVRVGNTTVFPWRAICALRITAQNNRQFIGTGWLISPRTVITAGHCVFMHAEGGWAKSIQVIPGCNDGMQPYGVHVGNVLRSTTGWVNNKDRNFDYGAIILPPSSRPGDSTGYFGLAVRNDAFLMGAALNLSGYPGDKGGRQQWFMAQRPKAVTDRVITYDIDSMGGQSGSPVWVLENGQRYGVGVHTNGSASGNSATRINTEVYNNLLNWKNLGM
ncbi:MAG: trypsin-like serine protease [Mycobacterium sp.]|nr:trypsin-like serine protease [Mycobacterium sp.]